MIRDAPLKYDSCSRTSYTHRKQKKTVKELLARFEKDKKQKKGKKHESVMPSIKEESKTPEESKPAKEVEP